MTGELHVACCTRKRNRGVRSVRFGRDNLRRRRQPGRGALALSADPLLVPEPADLVAGRHLPGDAAAHVLPGPIGKAGPVEIGCVEALRRIADVEVVELVGGDARAALRARVDEIPDAVLRDRPAHRAVEIVDLADRRGLREARGLQLRREIVRLKVLARAAEERGAFQAIAARLGHDVHDEAGRLGFAQSARRRERHFLRVAHVGDVGGRLIAARRVADVQAVDRQPAFVRAPAVNRELVDERSGRHVVGVGDHARHQQHHRVVVADGRNRSNRVRVQRGLAPRALHVDDRALAGDGDRFSERADFQVRVDGGRERAGQLDAFTSRGAEALEDEGDGVAPGPQVFDAVLAVAVGHCGTGLFDQRPGWPLRR